MICIANIAGNTLGSFPFLVENAASHWGAGGVYANDFVALPSSALANWI
jgi:hypothetical protein